MQYWRERIEVNRKNNGMEKEERKKRTEIEKTAEIIRKN